jgi:hypothetical protein
MFIELFILTRRDMDPRNARRVAIRVSNIGMIIPPDVDEYCELHLMADNSRVWALQSYPKIRAALKKTDPIFTLY